METLRLKPTEEELDAIMMKEVDTDGSGDIDCRGVFKRITRRRSSRQLLKFSKEPPSRPGMSNTDV